MKNLYVVMHTHDYGADTHLVRADRCPTEDEVIAAFHLDFEPERGEEIVIEAANEETILELGDQPANE